MTYGYIYKISFPNNKIYIGLTTTSIQYNQNTAHTYTVSQIEKLLIKPKSNQLIIQMLKK